MGYDYRLDAAFLMCALLSTAVYSSTHTRDTPARKWTVMAESSFPPTVSSLLLAYGRILVGAWCYVPFFNEVNLAPIPFPVTRPQLHIWNTRTLQCLEVADKKKLTCVDI